MSKQPSKKKLSQATKDQAKIHAIMSKRGKKGWRVAKAKMLAG
jgi:hypothetical protein